MRALGGRIPWSELGQVAGLYLAGSWLILQVIDVLANNLELPEWVFRAVLVLLILGLPAAIVATLVVRRPTQGRPRSWRTAGGAGLAMAGAAALLTLVPGVRETGRRALLGAEIPGVGVLPFRYSGPDSASHAYLAEQVSIKLSELVQRAGVLSPSWAAVQRFRGPLPAMAEVGRVLNVEYILYGNLVGNAGQLELSVWLTRARDDVAVWQKTYSGVSADLSDFQHRVAQNVVDSLSVAVGITPASITIVRYTDDPVADSLYDRGIYLTNQHYDADSIRLAGELFERAIARDSSFAPAYVALAATISSLSRVAWKIPPAEAGPRVRALLREADRIAPELTSVARDFGWYYYVFERDFTASRLFLEESIERNPKDAHAMTKLAFPLVSTGRTDSALAVMRAASALEPNNPLVVSTECWILYLAHRFPEGLARCEDVLERMQPDHLAALGIGELIRFTMQFMKDEEAPAAARDSAARALIAAGWPPPPDQYNMEVSLPMRLALLGWDEEARRILAEEMKCAGIRPLRVANAYAALGDMDAAWDWLERAYAEGDPNLAEAGVRPEMAPFREDPRWPEFAVQLGLAPPAD